MRIGHFPYRPGGNPYQSLFASSVEGAGIEVVRVPPFKIFPLHRAMSSGVDLLQLDWPHDWYTSKKGSIRLLKRFMYKAGLRKLSKFPCVWTVHNLVAHDALDTDDEYRMIQELVDCCDGLIVMSEAARQRVAETYSIPDRTLLKVVPHGHYIDVYENSVSREDARTRLGLDSSSRVVLSIGRMLPYKGLEELICAFGRVARADDVLVIAGSVASPDYLNELQQLASTRAKKTGDVVFHPGFVPDEKLQYYFNASDVVAMPFKNILNSGSLLLAMSFGKCVVAPNEGSLPEIAYSPGFFGYERSDVGGLEQSILDALNCENRPQLESSILSYAKSEYDWTNTGQQVRSLYDAILANVE